MIQSHFCWGISSWLKSTTGDYLSLCGLRPRPPAAARTSASGSTEAPIVPTLHFSRSSSPRARAPRLDWLINGRCINDNRTLIVGDKAARADLWRPRSGFNRKDQ